MSNTISTQVLNEINTAEAALAAAVGGDAQAAIDLAAVQTAQATSAASQANALALHVTASGLAQQALYDLRNELTFTGTDTTAGGTANTPPPAAAPSMSKMDMAFRTSKPKQHHAITRALNLGLSWGTILQALLQGGLTTLEQVIATESNQV